MGLFRLQNHGHIKNSTSESPLKLRKAETNQSRTTLDAVSPYWLRGGIRERRLEDYREKDDYIPRTEVEAQEHIAKNREEKGLHGTGSNKADLQRALIMYGPEKYPVPTCRSLSEQLYQESTHFLLELVQNVDDNAYTVSTLTLNIIYESRTLCIDCNEIGFGKRNVTAIVWVGESSKSKLNHARRYIGKKSIGFKSVFKVFDFVWIHSGHYSFKFDKSHRLGMIALIWTAFPAKIMPSFTSILLKLLQDCDMIELVREIKALDLRLLIFLQNYQYRNTEKGGKDPWQPNYNVETRR